MLRSDIVEVRTLRTDYESINSDAIRFNGIFSGGLFSMLLKFSFSEKVTKICAIFLMVLTFTK